ncbi:hypothetical protein LNP04_15640 [Chryseobacterium sp. C-71]|uniref:hypothetical protein n=1 Tax=Chryseobacterium sp. C-71 TaxID=2893882 RepID=UPI001E64F8B9|nr:hypothetical protein [Chryseobacterium sp. C-71]UFH31386.1 hypothetical protein LNP04_15640 [Chryseobacterium sp. C-71]
MKFKYILILYLIIPTFIFSQKNYKYSYNEGYLFLKKAQKQINKNNIKNARTLLNKAKDTNYGFCGNAWASANSEIKLIEAQILNINKNYDESLKILESIDGCSYGGNCIKRDSLKVKTLILKFGKDKVKNAFKNVNMISKIENEDDDEIYSAFIKDLNYKFNFIRLDILVLDKNGKSLVKNNTDNEFLDIIQNQIFYTLLE